MKPSELAEFLSHAWNQKLCVFIWGAPGIGKSSIAQQVATGVGADYIDVRLSQMDPADIKGLPFVKDGITNWARSYFWPNGERPSIVMLDELSAAPPLNQVAAYQVLTDRRIGDYPLPDNCVIWGAGNRMADRAVVYKMSSALANRLVHVELHVDTSDWISWALEHNIRHELIGFHRFRDSVGKVMLHNFDPKRDDRAYASPRTWEMVSRLMDTGMKNGLLEQGVNGTVGEAAGVEFIGWLRVYKSMPDIDMLIMQPAKAPIPEQPDVLCALTSALVARADENTFDSVIVYANRLPDEFSMLLVKDCLIKDISLSKTKAYVQWAVKHKEALGA